MSIEKKSLISTLKTTKKANVVKEDFAAGSANAGVKSPARATTGRAAKARVALAKPAPARIS
jgi:hypothetical protein